ncbi:MAG: hypothetical protein M3460_09040 [Actinomycetota bacterium]|nr:hypothetical protein [Actinomycetota bacterium]
MPIRTHRGRAAVYRRFWGWPVRSPKHLAGTVLALIAIAIGGGLALPDSRGGTTPAVPSNSPQANQFAPPSRSAVAEAGIAPQPRAPSPSTPAPASALTVARSWVRAFLTVPNGITSERWVEQLRPYTTDELLPELRSIDPANVPAAQINGEPRTVSSSPSSVEVDVPTTAVVVRLLLVSTPTGWRVAGYQRVG